MNNCRAVLVGSTTFGKGLIQSVYELMDGSGLILTVGKYVTPAHQDIDGNGIKPDFRRTPWYGHRGAQAQFVPANGSGSMNQWRRLSCGL